MTSPVIRLPIPGACQMTLKLNQGGQDAAIVLGATLPTGAGGMDTAFAAAWRDAAWTAFRPLMANSVSVTAATVRDVSGPDALVVEVGPPATNNTGSGVGYTAIAAAATLLRWTTAVGGRTGKGRTYVPGLTDGSLDSGRRLLTSSALSAGNAAIAAYIANTVWSVDRKPAVLSFTRGAARVITGGSCGPVAGVQRRRMR